MSHNLPTLNRLQPTRLQHLAFLHLGHLDLVHLLRDLNVPAQLPAHFGHHVHARNHHRTRGKPPSLAQKITP